jgi:hypothetical protein
MNRFLGDRFQDINDAIVSAPRASLLEMEQELSASLAQVKARLASTKNSKPAQPVLTGIPGHAEGLGRN